MGKEATQFKKGQPRPPNAGRKKGSLNKATERKLGYIENVRVSGKDPITFFADILRDEAMPLDIRMVAAKELAPYMHPKLSSIEARNGMRSHEERLQAMRKLLDENEETGPLLPPPGGGSKDVEGEGA